MVIPDRCDCDESKRPTASISTTLPDGWQQMDPSRVDFYTHIKCSHCGKILKPACTVRWQKPDGRLGWST